MAWNDDRVEQLKRLWAEGLSASQIASRIGGVTRNAVIGKVHRLGLSGRATPAKPSRGCDGFEHEEEMTATAPPPSFSRREIEALAPDPEFTAPVMLASGDLATVATLKNNMCKWPIGDPGSEDFCFCGHKPRDGSPYCEYHARLAYQPLQDRRHRKVAIG